MYENKKWIKQIAETQILGVSSTILLFNDALKYYMKVSLEAKDSMVSDSATRYAQMANWAIQHLEMNYIAACTKKGQKFLGELEQPEKQLDLFRQNKWVKTDG